MKAKILAMIADHEQQRTILTQNIGNMENSMRQAAANISAYNGAIEALNAVLESLDEDAASPSGDETQEAGAGV
jgi:NAD-dependent SIR2 family protein deacetylase